VAGSVNKVILIGNLGADPDIRTMQSGDKVANLSIATSESWKDKASGEKKEKTEWHRVSIFNQPLVSVAENYLKKGAKVYIEGQIETRKWTDQSGQEKYTTEVVLRPYKSELTMLDARGQQGGGGYASSAPSYGDSANGAAPRNTTGGARPATNVDSMEDEIPF